MAMTDFNKWPWVGEWECAGCKAPLASRWKHWEKDKLWEFLTKCPTCGSSMMIQTYTPPKLGFTGFKNAT